MEFDLWTLEQEIDRRDSEIYKKEEAEKERQLKKLSYKKLKELFDIETEKENSRFEKIRKEDEETRRDTKWFW